jgi:uncharacterized protein (TIGR03643 family)
MRLSPSRWDNDCRDIAARRSAIRLARTGAGRGWPRVCLNRSKRWASARPTLPVSGQGRKVGPALAESVRALNAWHQIIRRRAQQIVEMALSDHISFTQISAQHGVTPDQIKAIMRTQLKPGSYRAWRKRVRDFGDRREHYK